MRLFNFYPFYFIKFFIIFLIFFLFLILHKAFSENVLLDFSFSTFDTHHFWNKKGKRRDSYTHFKKKEIELYWELNTHKIGVFAVESSYASICDRLNGNTYGFSDIEVNWTFQPYEEKLPFFWINLTSIIPAGREKASLRYGCWAFELAIHYSNVKIINQFPLWFDFGLGYRVYNGFPSDQLKAIINTAAAFSSNLYLYCIANLDWGLFNGHRKEHYNQILFNPNYRLLKVEIGVVNYFTKWMYIEAGYFCHLWGANVGTGGGFIGGFGFCF